MSPAKRKACRCFNHSANAKRNLQAIIRGNSNSRITITCAARAIAKESPDFLCGCGNWQGLQTIAMAQRRRQIKEQEEITAETHYYISSLPNDAQSLLQAIRSHWGIENSLHWVLDVAMGKDDSRVRKDHAPQNLGLLRRLALTLLKQETTAKVGVQAKRRKAGWDEDYLLNVLGVS